MSAGFRRVAGLRRDSPQVGKRITVIVLFDMIEYAQVLIKCINPNPADLRCLRRKSGKSLGRSERRRPALVPIAPPMNGGANASKCRVAVAEMFAKFVERVVRTGVSVDLAGADSRPLHRFAFGGKNEQRVRTEKKKLLRADFLAPITLSIRNRRPAIVERQETRSRGGFFFFFSPKGRPIKNRRKHGHEIGTRPGQVKRMGWRGVVQCVPDVNVPSEDDSLNRPRRIRQRDQIVCQNAPFSSLALDTPRASDRYPLNVALLSYENQPTPGTYTDNPKMEIPYEMSVFEQTATFHITEADPTGGPKSCILCETSRSYMVLQKGRNPPPLKTIHRRPRQTAPLGQTERGTAPTRQKKRVRSCGITFSEFRNSASASLPDRIIPTSNGPHPAARSNIHDGLDHTGKRHLTRRRERRRPSRMISLRKDMEGRPSKTKITTGRPKIRDKSTEIQAIRNTQGSSLPKRSSSDESSVPEGTGGSKKPATSFRIPLQNTDPKTPGSGDSYETSQQSLHLG